MGRECDPYCRPILNIGCLSMRIRCHIVNVKQTNQMTTMVYLDCISKVPLFSPSVNMYEKFLKVSYLVLALLITEPLAV